MEDQTMQPSAGADDYPRRPAIETITVEDLPKAIDRIKWQRGETLSAMAQLTIEHDRLAEIEQRQYELERLLTQAAALSAALKLLISVNTPDHCNDETRGHPDGRTRSE